MRTARPYVVIAAVASCGLAALAIAQVVVPPGPNKLAFPEGWDKGVMYATVDRYDTKQYREFWGPAEAVKAAREGQPVPYGTVLTLAAYAAKLDAAGVPIKDANGRFVKDKLLAVNSMMKGQGFGADIPAEVRNGDWIYQSFSPDGKVNDKANLTSCFQCHLPFAKDDYLTNMAKLSGKFPSDAKATAKAGPGEVIISDFSLRPGGAQGRGRAARHLDQRRRHAAPDQRGRRQGAAQRADAQGPGRGAAVRRSRQHRLHLRAAPRHEGHDRGGRQIVRAARAARAECACGQPAWPIDHPTP